MICALVAPNHDWWLPEAILIAQLAPILAAMAAVFLLPERLTVFRLCVLGLGFAGIIALVWPELGANDADGVRMIAAPLVLAGAGVAAAEKGRQT